MHKNVIGAIFRRNFVSYFSNPTGYLFIGVFLLASSLAAFWPDEFFNANLANLDQLNRYLPLILVVFIPAITMSLWSDERRQGTDELLLTIPASDFDVVLGKFLGAISIYTVALLFSFVSNLIVFVVFLGYPDPGLFLANYFGYWMVGVAMLSVGMVASFLSHNLTVSFVLGALFNLSLALIVFADTIVTSGRSAVAIKSWSISDQFHDFGQGVISLTSLMYFGLIVVVMFYLSMVLIGRRHWQGGRDGQSLGGQYLVRTLALAGSAIGLVVIASQIDWRLDVSTAQLSSVAPETRLIMRSLKPEHPINIDAYVSPTVPESYVQTRLGLLSALSEIGHLGGKQVNVRIHNIEPLDDDAVRAEQQFGIKPKRVMSKDRGGYGEKDIFLSAAITSGLDSVVIPFFDVGIPAEYELVRSIQTLKLPGRKKLGVLATDLNLMETDPQADPREGGLPKHALLKELEKQYDVQRVDADKPIKDRYDVLLALQPSTLTPAQLENFLQVVKDGQPTAIFEDPAPFVFRGLTGTTQPKMPTMEQMMQQPPNITEKCDLAPLWQMLGVKLVGKAPNKDNNRMAFGPPPSLDASVVWQAYNPFPKISAVGQITHEWIFIQSDMPYIKTQTINQENPITSNLNSLFFLYPGAIEKREPSNELEKRAAAKLQFTPLVMTGNATGVISSLDVIQAGFNPVNLNDKEGKSTGEAYVLAARIQAVPPPDIAKTAKPADAAKAGEVAKRNGIDVVLVMDVDLLSDPIFSLRANPQDDLGWDFDNVAFVLNSIDVLAHEDPRVIEIRKRKAVHRKLVKIEERVADARKEAQDAQQKAIDSANQAKADAEHEKEAAIKEYANRLKKLVDGKGRISRREFEAANFQLASKTVELDNEYKNKVTAIDRDVQSIQEAGARRQDVVNRDVQNEVKLLAGFLPPIFPLLLAFFVYFHHRSREQEGVSSARLR